MVESRRFNRRIPTPVCFKLIQGRCGVSDTQHSVGSRITRALIEIHRSGLGSIRTRQSRGRSSKHLVPRS